MLSKHIENVRQKSENYRMAYAFLVSFLFTGVIASFWVFTWFIPDMGGVANSASVASAVDGSSKNVNSKDISPTGVVKQEAGNIWDSFFNSLKGISDKPFNNAVGSTSASNYPLAPVVFSTTTSSGITVEVNQSNIGSGDVGDINVSTSTLPVTDGN